ncbi:MAG: sensor histidine kinase, partial [Saprospiraceae bacterium]
EIDTFSLKRISRITHPEDRDIHHVFYEELLKGSRTFFEIEKRYIHKNGNIIWGRTAISLVRNDENVPIYTVAMIQDITQHKKQEERIHQLLDKLKVLNAELEETIDERTKKLVKTNEELMRSNQDLEQFAYAASHDLQEPLRMVGNFVQLLDRKYGDKLDENGKTYINFAVEGVTRMSKLIKSLLLYSRAGRKEAATRVADIGKIVEHKLLDLEQLIKDKNAIVNIEPMPEKVICEPVQLGLVFYNLVVNGLKFNEKEQPTILISCKELEEYWCFRVTDNGMGIEDAYKDKIFEIFKRLNRRDEYDGTGIGLALCKKVVYRHKGKIWFDSSFGEGTTFYFTIAKELQ